MSLPPFLQLKCLQAQFIETDGGAILKRGCTEIRISGTRAAEVLTFILRATSGEGSTAEAICESFAAPDRPAVRALVEKLADKRILVPIASRASADTSDENHLNIFYWHFGESAARITERLNSNRMVILGINFISRQMAAAFDSAGNENFDIVDDPLLRNLCFFDNEGRLLASKWPPALKAPLLNMESLLADGPNTCVCIVATCDFGGRQVLREWNRFCVERNLHYLPVVLHNLIGYVGPLVIPGVTACYECLWTRENSHMDHYVAKRSTEDLGLEGQRIVGFHPSMASILGDIAVLELTKFHGDFLPTIRVGTLIEVNALAMKVEPQKALKIPRCAVCSALNRRSSENPKKVVFHPAERLGRAANINTIR